MSKQTTGKRIAGKYAKFPDGRVVYGPVWWEKLAASIDRAMNRQASEAATHAMKAERERIKRAVTTRMLNLPAGTFGYRVLESVLQDIEGPMSGAPKKGAMR